MSKSLFIDLFSGLGGASEAFMRSKSWDVVRIENNPELSFVPNTVTQSVLDIKSMMENFDRVDSMINYEKIVVWASPPCREFSLGYAAPGPKAKREGREFNPDMMLLRAAINFINYVDPDVWVIENVKGSVPYFKDEMGPGDRLLGSPNQIIDSILLWGNFQPLILPKGFKHIKQDAWSTTPFRSNIRAMIPIQVSEALLESCSQVSLSEWV